MMTIRQARNWFKNKGIYDRFCELLRERRLSSFEAAFEEYRGCIIINSFSWSTTREGSDYWGALHSEFADAYNAGVKVEPKDVIPLFKTKQKVKVKKKLSSDVVDINDDMRNFCGKKVTIDFIDTEGYDNTNENQDGLLYFIKEDFNINVWTSEMFEN